MCAQRAVIKAPVCSLQVLCRATLQPHVMRTVRRVAHVASCCGQAQQVPLCQACAAVDQADHHRGALHGKPTSITSVTACSNDSQLHCPASGMVPLREAAARGPPRGASSTGWVCSGSRSTACGTVQPAVASRMFSKAIPLHFDTWLLNRVRVGLCSSSS